MFSQLGPLFRTTFRQAEANDTRQSIPHDERDKNRKKREEEEQKQLENDLWNDDTSVSVEALKAFLINFLKTMPEAQDGTLRKFETPDESLSTRPQEQKRPTNTHNAKAVRAYQTMAKQGQTTSIKPPETDKPVYGTAELLDSKELREVYQLIDDLEVLASKGINRLDIPKADNFVESLKNSVAHQKSKFKN